jgi:heptosyltransferase-1
MPRILLVKTTSLGDIVHNLPVASDIASALPGAEIDWVVEESMAKLPALHAFVAHPIPVAIRRWRRSFWQPETRREISAFLERLRAFRYDAIIDTQGLVKSALITRAARGPRYGFSWRASREPLFPFYNRTFNVPWNIHAVERNRMLAARALDYETPANLDYGLRVDADTSSPVTGASYVVLLHGTSASKKLWPEERWIELGRAMAGQGLPSVLPWGSEEEERRSRRLAAAIEDSIVPRRMPIEALASLLARARYAIGVDTGLTHLAGALDVPSVGIYVATDPQNTGLHCARAVNVGGRGKMPAIAEVLQALQALSA